MSASLATSFFAPYSALILRQRKELIEIVVDWETKNQYAVLDESGQELGTVAERAGGMGSFFKRAIFKSHRGFRADFMTHQGNRVLGLSRGFFFFFSELEVHDDLARNLGRVRRRFGLIYKRYDLEDSQGKVFAHIKSPRWRLWTFAMQSPDGQELGEITKRWGGALREIFTDADTYRIDLSKFSDAQKAVVFAAAVSIDFDFFENNQGSSGVLDMITGD